MKRFLTIFIAILTLYTYSSISAANAEKSLSFQGQLFETNAPKTGSVNATFTFYDSLSGGSITGSPIAKTVPVSNGYFGTQFSESDTTGVDFNQQLYLEVSINGTTLSPRTSINPTVSSLKTFGTFSYAIAPTVGPAGSLYFNTTDDALYTSNGTSWTTASSSWLRNGSSTYYMTGNVGIGSSTPSAKLTVAGDIRIDDTISRGLKLMRSGIAIGDITTANSRFTFQDRAGAGVEFTSSSSASMMMLTGVGNLGIGTSTPFSKLDVVGDINISKDSAYKYNGQNIAIASTTIFNYFLGGSGNLTATGTTNTALGSSALASLTGGSDNTAIGAAAMLSNTSGYSNTVVGRNAFRLNTTGYQNVAMGNEALYTNSTGFGNAAVGYQALRLNAGGIYNTAFGRVAMSNNSSGSRNTAFGNGALLGNTTGSSSVAIGDSAGLTNTIGSNNTFLGYSADVLTNGLSNATAIGYNSKVGCSNCLVLGGTGADSVFVGIGTTTPQFKLDVQDLNNAAVAQFTSDYTAGDGRKYGSIIIGKSSATSQGAQFGYVYNPASSLDSFAHITPFGTPEGEVFVVTRRSNVGVGTTTPEAKFSISANVSDTNSILFSIASSTSATSTSNLFTVTNAGVVMVNKSKTTNPVMSGNSNQLGIQQFGFPGQQNTITMYANGGANNVIAGYSTPGTADAPTATLADSFLLRLAGGAHTGSTYTSKAEISMMTSENWSSTSTGAHIVFYTTATSSTSRTEKMRLMGSGFLGLGTTTPSAQLTTTGSVRFASLGSGGANLITDSLGNVTVSSDERLKDIQGDFITGLDKIKGITPITYKWKPETGYDASSTYAGFSAQNIQANIPEAVSTDSRGFLTLADRPILAALVNAVKELGAWFEGGKFKVQSDVCVDDFCMTKDEFKAMMMNAKYGGNIQTHTNTVTPPPATEPQPESEVIPEQVVPVEAPVVEPTPEPTPTPTE